MCLSIDCTTNRSVCLLACLTPCPCLSFCSLLFAVLSFAAVVVVRFFLFRARLGNNRKKATRSSHTTPTHPLPSIESQPSLQLSVVAPASLTAGYHTFRRCHKPIPAEEQRRGQRRRLEEIRIWLMEQIAEDEKGGASTQVPLEESSDGVASSEGDSSAEAAEL